MTTDRPILNENQVRHLLASCQYVDNLLRDIDMILASSAAPAAFEKHINDTTPVERGVMRDYLLRIRQQLVRSLAVVGLAPAPPSISTRHAVRTSMGFVEIAVDELRPDDMRGYGALDPAADAQITGMVEELLSIVRQFDAFLGRGSQNLQEQVARLGERAPNRQLLTLLSEVVERQALLEFRPTLEMILSRAAQPRYEVAVFGRVSTGKSSLLNHLMGADFLPVGVTPITAVPTRLVYGPAPRVLVAFADAASKTLGLDALPEFATEALNPANTRRVTQLTVECPSPLLRDGVVFVDTPGLGSLASHGTAEALAYLPRCDLALLLTDASAVVSSDDVATAARLQTAGIATLVVVSKADLLTASQIDSVLRYTEQTFGEQLGTAPVVSAVSTVPSHEHLLLAWLDTVLRPRLADHQRYLFDSLTRKIDQLADDVVRALTRRAEGQVRTPAPGTEPDALGAELRDAAARFETARTEIEALIDAAPGGRTEVFVTAAQLMLAQPPQPSRDALVAAVDAFALRLAGEVRRIVEQLEAASAAALAHIGRALDLPGPEPAPPPSEMPRIQLGDTVTVGTSALWNTLGSGFAAGRLSKTLARDNDRAVSDAVSTYARVLADWSKRALREARARFDADADRYRTVLSPSANTRAGTDTVAVELAAIAVARTSSATDSR